jgi:ankyrin repeat protein
MNNQIINEYIKALNDGNVDEVIRMTDRGRNKHLLDAIPKDAEGRNTLPALFVAIQNDNTEMLEKLLMMGADTEVAEAAELYDPETRQLYEDITPIYYAIHKGSPEAVRMLIASGANLNHYTSNSGTDEPNWEHPLAYAVQMAGEEPETMLAIIDLILSSGENIDELEVTLNCPILNKSVDLHAFAITKLLIDKYQHADTDEIIYRDEYYGDDDDDDDDVPNLLMRAIRETESPDEIVNFLLENGADPNNNIRFPYGYHQILDPEFARSIESTEYQVYFDFTKERLEEYLREVMVGHVAELDNRMQTALDFAMRNDASPEMINALRTHGGKTTSDILRDHGIDFDVDYDPNNDSWASSEGEGYAEIDTENSEIRSKLLDIPVMTKEQYQQCRVAMNTQDNEPLHDFLTGEELYPEDVVILPTETSNVTCMDRDSFVDYMVHQSKNYDPLLHPYTREDMNNLPGFVFDEWWAENYPLGTTHYKEALKKVRLATNGGARRATKTKRLRTKRRKNTRKTNTITKGKTKRTGTRTKRKTRRMGTKRKTRGKR